MNRPLPPPKNNYPTFPNQASIGSGVPYESLARAPELVHPSEQVEGEAPDDQVPLGLHPDQQGVPGSSWGGMY